jgi:hypothetical protein
MSHRRSSRGLAASSLVALLTACGGGGDSTPPPPPPTEQGVLVSADSPVAAGCTGGRSGGTVYVNAEVEPFIAGSPAPGGVLIGAWQQDRASDGGSRAIVSARSEDGGQTWTRTLQPMSRCGGAAAGAPGDRERATDPWVDIGADGTAYLMSLAFSGANFTAGSVNEMLVSRSTNGGATWSAPVSLQRDGAAGFNDKNTLTADPTDPRFVYAVWNRLDAAGNGPTLLARSTEAGVSWEPTRTIYTPVASGGVSQTLGNRIAVITEGADSGTLINVFTQIDTVAGQSQATLRVIRSADKGLTWSGPVTVNSLQAVGTRDGATGAAVRDGALVPTITVGAGSDVWVAWQDARFNGGQHDAIALSRSPNAGRTWNEPRAVNKDLSVAAFTPALRFDSNSGLVGLSYFDLRSNTADRSTLLADLWLLTSLIGVSWIEEEVVRAFDLSAAPQATGGLFIGDYHGLASDGGRFLPLAALSSTDTGNRTDVRLIPVTIPGALAVRERGRSVLAVSPPVRVRVPVLSAADAQRFAAARHAAIKAAMEARIPGWSRISGAR